MKILFLFLFLTGDLQKPFYLEGFVENFLGFNMEESSKENLKENIKNYPNCDFFYIPLLRERDSNAFKEYFINSGNEPLFILYLLKNFEFYEENLKNIKVDKMELLRRFLWTLQIEKKENRCPFNLNLKKPEIKGFQDEISEDYYKLFLIFSFGNYQDSIVFIFDKEFEREIKKEEILKLMQKYKIPLLHRQIEQKTPKEIKKLKGNN